MSINILFSCVFSHLRHFCWSVYNVIFTVGYLIFLTHFDLGFCTLCHYWTDCWSLSASVYVACVDKSGLIQKWRLCWRSAGRHQAFFHLHYYHCEEDIFTYTEHKLTAVVHSRHSLSKTWFPTRLTDWSIQHVSDCPGSSWGAPDSWRSWWFSTEEETDSWRPASGDGWHVGLCVGAGCCGCLVLLLSIPA